MSLLGIGSSIVVLYASKFHVSFLLSYSFDHKQRLPERIREGLLPASKI